MITLHISNKIKLSGLPPNVEVHLKKTLTLPNPMYYKMLNLGKRVYPSMMEYKYWAVSPDKNLLVPRGMRERLEIFFQKEGLEYEIVDQTIKDKRREMFQKTVELRDYQVPLVLTALDHTESLIHVGTGAGKTIIACELFHRTGLTGTVLVPNTILLKQFVGEFKKHYGYTPGIIGDGEKEIKEITVATVQGLMADEKLLQALVAVTGMLIVDECQGFVTKERLRIIESFMPSRIYGLSATPTRSKDDGRTKAIGFYFGNAWVKYETTQMTPKVHAIQTGVEIEAGEYQRMVETMVRSPERNKLIAGLVIGEAVAGRKILVLTKRIEHYKALQEMLGEREFFHYIDSEDKERNDKLADFKNGDRDYVAIFGTTSLLAVGLDIPSFDTLILACDMKSEVLTVQSCGRILRLFEGKPEPKIIDLWDNRCGVFNRHYYIRKQIYQQKGWEIEVSLDFNNK